MASALPVVLLGAAGFAFGGVYSLYSQHKPWWAIALLAVIGVLFAVGGVLYL